MTSCLLHMENDPSSLASYVSLLLLNFNQSPQKLTLSLPPLHWLLGLLHLKYFYFNCGVILDGRKRSILYSKLFLRKLKVKVAPCYCISQEDLNKKNNVNKEDESSSLV